MCACGCFYSPSRELVGSSGSLLHIDARMASHPCRIVVLNSMKSKKNRFTLLPFIFGISFQLWYRVSSGSQCLPWWRSLCLFIFVFPHSKLTVSPCCGFFLPYQLSIQDVHVLFRRAQSCPCSRSFRHSRPRVSSISESLYLESFAVSNIATTAFLLHPRLLCCDHIYLQRTLTYDLSFQLDEICP